MIYASSHQFFTYLSIVALSVVGYFLWGVWSAGWEQPGLTMFSVYIDVITITYLVRISCNGPNSTAKSYGIVSMVFIVLVLILSAISIFLPL